MAAPSTGCTSSLPIRSLSLVASGMGSQLAAHLFPRQHHSNFTRYKVNLAASRAAIGPSAGSSSFGASCATLLPARTTRYGTPKVSHTCPSGRRLHLHDVSLKQTAQRVDPLLGHAKQVGRGNYAAPDPDTGRWHHSRSRPAPGSWRWRDPRWPALRPAVRMRSAPRCRS